MNSWMTVYHRIENLSVLCKVMAEALLETENEHFDTNEFSACLFHCYESLDLILDQIDLILEEE